MSTNWPQFQLETIAVALQNLLATANYPFVAQAGASSVCDRHGVAPQNAPSANQPYLGLLLIGVSQVENQAQGLEKWLLHFRVLVYIRADASPNSVPGTELNKALQAVVEAMRSAPVANRQTLGGLVDNAWIEGDILIDTGVLDQQCAMLIPIVVDTGI